MFRVPYFLREHPVESLLAAMLLVGLLFIAADGTTASPQAAALTITEKR